MTIKIFFLIISSIFFIKSFGSCDICKEFKIINDAENLIHFGNLKVEYYYKKISNFQKDTTCYSLFLNETKNRYADFQTYINEFFNCNQIKALNISYRLYRWIDIINKKLFRKLKLFTTQIEQIGFQMCIDNLEEEIINLKNKNIELTNYKLNCLNYKNTLINQITILIQNFKNVQNLLISTENNSRVLENNIISFRNTLKDKANYLELNKCCWY